MAHDQSGSLAVLVGELDGNPGTSMINAIEKVAALVSDKLPRGRTDFDLHQYAPLRIPEPDEPEPTLYKVTWSGGRPFTMPTWDKVDPDLDPWLRHIKGTVKAHDYTMNSLLSELDGNLELVDGTAEPLP